MYFINELKKLNQPWNPAVCAAIKLLSQPDAVSRWSPKIIEYHYGECPFINNHWFLPNSRDPQQGPIPLGIVLHNVFEVTIHDRWWEDHKYKRRLIPIAMLTPGAVFGAFEFCDLLSSVPQLGNYEVSAGSRSFKIVRRASVSIRTSGGQFYKSLPDNLRSTWGKALEDNDALVRYYGLEKKWTAKILLLLKIPILFSLDEKEFVDVISREAWKQSRALREGHIKWLQHDFTPKKITDRDSKGVSKPLTTVISKFKRKLELAISEQCVVFGTPPIWDHAGLSRYGPIGELVEKMNNCGEKPQNIKKKYQLRNKVQKEDILIPMFLHDSAHPSYLSLSDDALVFHNNSSKKGLTVIQQQAKQVAHAISETKGQQCEVESVTQTGKVDPFWCGAVQLRSSFPHLPCLEAVKCTAGKRLFADCVIVFAQHLLEETGSLIQALLEINGTDFANRMFVIGKPYSSNVRVWQRIRNMGVHVEDLLYEWERGWFENIWRSACEKLWSKVQDYLENKPDIRKILILDDGGMLHQTIPSVLVEGKRVIGVEQTSKGLRTADACGFPIIGVACSTAKKRLEPSIIADTTWKKLRALFPQACATQTVAVCGLGNIGRRFAQYLSELKVRHDKLLIWDDNHEIQDSFQIKGAKKAQSLSEIFQESEVILGCTGTDITHDVLDTIETIQDRKTRYLVSCSSYDVEFASLLRNPATCSIPDINPFGFAKYEKHEGTTFVILQGGFPVTFDRSPSAAPIELIQLTRGLLLAGLIQAAKLEENSPHQKIPLDAEAQITVVETWRRVLIPDDKEWISKIRDHSLKWWNPSPDMDEKVFVEKHSRWPSIKLNTVIDPLTVEVLTHLDEIATPN